MRTSRTHRWAAVVVVIGAVAALATGCQSVKVGPNQEAAALRMEGLVNGYVSVYGLNDFDGNMFKVGVLDRDGRSGELVYVDLWPFAGVGVGAAGARVRVLFLDVGIGTLFYDPVPPPPPPHRPSAKREDEPESSGGNSEEGSGE